MGKLMVGALIATMVACVSTNVQAMTSAPQPVWVDVAGSLQWKTVMSASPALSLNWPQGAVKARLRVACGGKTVRDLLIDDVTLVAYPLDLGIPTTIADERVYTLTLDYVDGQDAVIETCQAELGAVRGVNGATARCVNCDTAERAWRRYKSDHVVLPIPEDATSLSVDEGLALEAAGPGWKQLDLSGKHALVLSVGDDSWVADVDLGIFGTVLYLR